MKGVCAAIWDREVWLSYEAAQVLSRYLWHLLWPSSLDQGDLGSSDGRPIAHALLYVMMLALPLTGIVAAGVGGEAVHFGALITLPQIGAPDANLRALAMRVHRPS